LDRGLGGPQSRSGRGGGGGGEDIESNLVLVNDKIPVKWKIDSTTGILPVNFGVSVDCKSCRKLLPQM
jgi:hypothetical protein